MFDLEDEKGSIRCVIWPDVLVRCAGYVRPEARLLVSGWIDRRGDVDAANLIITDLVPLEEVDSRAFEGLTRASERGNIRRQSWSKRPSWSAPLPVPIGSRSWWS